MLVHLYFARTLVFCSYFDVTTAFLNGKLEERVFMEVLKYAVEALQEIARASSDNESIAKKGAKMLDELARGDIVCLLGRALYRLRQVGRC